MVDTSATYLSETASSTGRARKHEKEAAAGIGHSCSSNFANVPGLMFLSPETGCQIRRPSVSTTRSLFHHRSDSQVPAMYLFSPRLAHLAQDESCLNPRPAGVWLVTRPAGGGAQRAPPLRSPKLLDRFPNFKRHSIALYVNYPYKVKYLTRRSLMTSQVRSKSEFSTFRAWRHRRVKFRC